MMTSKKAILIGRILLTALIVSFVAHAVNGQQSGVDVYNAGGPSQLRQYGPCPTPASQQGSLNTEKQRHDQVMQRLLKTMEVVRTYGRAGSPDTPEQVQAEINHENQVHQCNLDWIHQGCPTDHPPCQPLLDYPKPQNSTCPGPAPAALNDPWIAWKWRVANAVAQNFQLKTSAYASADFIVSDTGKISDDIKGWSRDPVAISALKKAIKQTDPTALRFPEPVSGTVDVEVIHILGCVQPGGYYILADTRTRRTDQPQAIPQCQPGEQPQRNWLDQWVCPGASAEPLPGSTESPRLKGGVSVDVPGYTPPRKPTCVNVSDSTHITGKLQPLQPKWDPRGQKSTGVEVSCNGSPRSRPKCVTRPTTKSLRPTADWQPWLDNFWRLHDESFDSVSHKYQLPNTYVVVHVKVFPPENGGSARVDVLSIKGGTVEVRNFVKDVFTQLDKSRLTPFPEQRPFVVLEWDYSYRTQCGKAPEN
jgi:hypothetical protein